MKKFYIAFLLVFLINFILLFINSSETIISSHQKKLKVGLVFDVGGRGDKSFNDSAYKGLEDAIKNLEIDGQYIEPGEGADRESALRLLASEKFDIVFGIGFIFTDDITNIAKEYPDVKFACIDYAVKVDENGVVVPPPENVAALKFREEEGSFLVGVIAALVSKTNKIGFVGGMDIPLIHKFEAGYCAGAKTVKPDIEIISNYAGVTGTAFKDPAKGKELALSQYNKGVDIIFHASGSTGLGVFEAARMVNKLAIGVDADQYFEAPGYILTSMIKRVDVAVYKTIEDCLNNQFTGGIKNFGLNEKGVDYVYDDNNKNLIPSEVIKVVEELKEKIIKGEIKVPSTK
ncbi:MAG TPA: BMP family ABC transporter substrate-binding protein [bacterium]|nr:BMP family ABC transporter substrate-binding protein [bacterium]HOL46795.1 BMP family ABC transporter substrate-binding protein [bacterium]HPQ17750.1 BMP family ABC transporter substrate-binding protein [bacterium]